MLSVIVSEKFAKRQVPRQMVHILALGRADAFRSSFVPCKTVLATFLLSYEPKHPRHLLDYYCRISITEIFDCFGRFEVLPRNDRNELGNALLEVRDYLSNEPLLHILRLEFQPHLRM